MFFPLALSIQALSKCFYVQLRHLPLLCLEFQNCFPVHLCSRMFPQIFKTLYLQNPWIYLSIANYIDEERKR